MSVAFSNAEKKCISTMIQYLKNKITTTRDGRPVNVDTQYPENSPEFDMPTIVCDTIGITPNAKFTVGDLYGGYETDEVRRKIIKYRGIRYEGTFQITVFATSISDRTDISGQIDKAIMKGRDESMNIPLIDTDPVASEIIIYKGDMSSVNLNSPDLDIYQTTKRIFFRTDIYEGEEYDMVDSVEITSNAYSGDIAIPPVARAGKYSTYTVSVSPGTYVGLDGTGSYDPGLGAITYLWEQISGSKVTLSGSDTANPHFYAIDTDFSQDSKLKFKLTVTNGYGLTSSSSTIVFIKI